MALSRLENFIKNVEGNILYVNPNDLDSTDDISNQGNSLTRPFKTVQRALLEAARFSYQIGINNDKFDKTTIMLYPGEHIIDNRPGYSINASGTVFDATGTVPTGTNDLIQFSGISIFDINNPANELYKYNSIHGGVIVPRGTSIVGMDLRKTKIRPKYVPDPTDPNQESSAIFRVTGACYFWQFSIFDGSGGVYKNNLESTYAPDFSHHKLTCFEYADGVNVVKGSEDTVNGRSGFTDLQMYYHKLTRAYGDASGRRIESYPISADFQPRTQESRIVGSLGGNVDIEKVTSGDGLTPSTTVTVKTKEDHDFGVGSPIRIDGVDGVSSPSGYDGLFLVSRVEDSKTFRYISAIVPSPPEVEPQAAKVNVEVDTVTGASPYIFNISLRSVFGMQGLHADGSKATGFKSMVTAQFTGVSLQKDDNAFVKFNETSGLYESKEDIASGENILHLDSRAIYKPEYENTHIKMSNDAVVQAVSIFAIGYAKHFECIDGGDVSLTNSNSNFGAVALASRGFRNAAFNRDNRGFITNIIPSQALVEDNSLISKRVYDIDAIKTKAVNDPSKLYLNGYTSRSIIPPSSFDNYKVGAKIGERLYAPISLDVTGTNAYVVETHSSPVLMQVPQTSSNEISSVKKYFVKRTTGNNVIDSSNTFTLTGQHDLMSGEKIRINSENGALPNGLVHNQVYYAIRIDGTRIRIAAGYDEAIAGTALNINNKGGRLIITSNVTDKISGDVGHPVQWDSNNNQWYIISSSNFVSSGDYGDNQLYGIIKSSEGSEFNTIPGVSITRRKDFRRNRDLSYKLRYVIPKEETDARAPLDSFNIQESSSTNDYHTEPLDSSSKSKNNKFISECTYDNINGKAIITSERAHNLRLSNRIIINNVKSSSNPDGEFELGFNGMFIVNEIIDDLKFAYDLVDNPGDFIPDTERTTSIPNFQVNQYSTALSIYSSEVIQEYKPTISDGIYHLTVVDNSVEPNVNLFDNGRYKFPQAVGDLIPRTDRDNPEDDFDTAVSYADTSQIGTVFTNDPSKSISKESISKFLVSSGRASSIESIVSTDISGSDQSSITVTTTNGHGFRQVSSVIINSPGSNFVNKVHYGIRIRDLDDIAEPTGAGGATAEVRVENGEVVSVTIMDGGSAYSVDKYYQLDGIPVQDGTEATVATVQVSGVLNIERDGTNPGTSIEISGVRNVTSPITDESIPSLNGTHELISVIDKNTFTYNVGKALGTIETEIYDGHVVKIGPTIKITSMIYDNDTGVISVVCDDKHGLSQGNKVRIVDSNIDGYNGYHIVYKVNEQVSESSNSFEIKYVKGLNIPEFTGGSEARLLKTAYASQEGLPNTQDEKISGRQSPFYTGITKQLSNTVSSTNTEIFVNDSKGLHKGDFIQIKDEILRIKDESTSGGQKLFVLRGQLGTRAADYPEYEVVRKISPVPVELRRPSILRASGHTFEYLGFGPGNYSTALPQRQDRVRREREIVSSQARMFFGGVAVYTGMNDQGDFYIGNKRIISPTGEEVVVDTPFPADTSENEISRLKIDTDDVLVGKRLRVEGGLDQEMVSSFGGPVVFSNNINVLGEEGVQAINLNLSGNLEQPRKITISQTRPVNDGKVGDIVLNALPSSGGFTGWVYTVASEWRTFGLIGASGDINTITTDGVAADVGIFNTLTVNQTSVFSGESEMTAGAKIKDIQVGISTNTEIDTSTGNLILDSANGTTIIDDNLNVTGNLVVDNTTTLNKTLDVTEKATFEEVQINSGVSTFTNLNVTGVATFDDIDINGGNSIVTNSQISNLTVSGVSAFTSPNPSSIQHTFQSGIVGIETGVRVSASGGFNNFEVNKNSVHPRGTNVTSSRGIRIINHVTSVPLIDSNNQVTQGSGIIKLDFRCGNNFEIDPGGGLSGVNGSCQFANPVMLSAVAGQQGSIELRVQEGSDTTFSWGDAFYFPGGTPPTIGAGTITLLGYYVFEDSDGVSPGKIMISGIEDLRPAS